MQGLGFPLVVPTARYRSLLTPFLDYINQLLALSEPRKRIVVMDVPVHLK